VGIWYLKYLEKQKDQQGTGLLLKPANSKTATFEEVDTSTANIPQCREVGSEWLCLKVSESLGTNKFLESRGFSRKETELALLGIISRAVYPCPEHKTAQWLAGNSALWELFETINTPPNRFTLYRMAEKLSEHFGGFTAAVYKNTMDLFDLKDSLMIFGLSSTYFGGRKSDGILAQFGRSKEKRSDCKLMSFSAVANPHGFLRYSKMDSGNIADGKTLLGMIKTMRKNSKTGHLDQTVAIGAGIATEDNLKALRSNSETYICVSRTPLKDYQDYTTENTTQITGKRGPKIEIKLMGPTDKPDKWLPVKSELKAKKEAAILSRAEQKFEGKLTATHQSTHKKRGAKTLAGVWERMGRAKQQCTRAHNNYDIDVKEKNGMATQISLAKKDSENDNRSGAYFIRTNVEGKTGQETWDIHSTIREVEPTFRCLKTDLKIRPVFHQKDKYPIAHIQLGLMAYQIVTAIRHRLKQNDIHHCWSTIVRIMNSQKMNTTQMKMKTKEVHIRKMSIPGKSVDQIYNLMGVKSFPKPNRKYVVCH